MKYRRRYCNIATKDEVIHISLMKKIKDRFKEFSNLAQNNPNIKEGLEQIKKKVDIGMQTAKSQWDTLGSDTQEKYTNAINQAFEMIPMLQEIGYETEEFLVNISVPPSIEIRLNYKKSLQKETLAIYKQTYKDHSMFVKVLEALYMAGKFQTGFKTGNLKPKGIQIQVGFPPRVALVYAPEPTEPTEPMAKLL